jgi:superfamily II DNA/RNA helicase
MTSSFPISLAWLSCRQLKSRNHDADSRANHPVVLEARMSLGAAQTQRNRSLFFTAAAAARMMKHETRRLRPPATQCVRGAAARELADQVAQQVKLYKVHNLRNTVVFGGMDMKPQTAELKRRGGA